MTLSMTSPIDARAVDTFIYDPCLMRTTKSLSFPRYLAPKLPTQTDRQSHTEKDTYMETDTSTDNKGRLKLTACESIEDRCIDLEICTHYEGNRYTTTLHIY